MNVPATSSCRCKKKPCNCIRPTLVNGPPLVYNNFSNLMWQTGVYQPCPLLVYGGAVLQSAWSTLYGGYAEWPHVLYTTDQKVRECVPASGRRKKRDPPITPKVSVSSPSPKELGDQNNAGEAPIGDRKYACETCKRAFAHKHVLQNHERTHTGEKPFVCDQCSKKFNRDHHLKTHMRLHTGEKPYKCDYCDKTFIQIANQRRHVRAHTGERPFKCQHPTCMSTFGSTSQLKAHTLIHTNEKPYVCPNCNQRYRHSHHLKWHKCSHNSCTDDGDTVIKNESDAVVDDSEDSKSDPTTLTTLSDEPNVIVDDSEGSKSNLTTLCDEPNVIGEDCEDSKFTLTTQTILTPLSDETISNDSCVSPGRKMPSDSLYQPWAYTSPVTPTDAINLNSHEQNEPIDLSVKMKYRSTNNNNSNDSTGDFSGSTSPLDELNLSPRSKHVLV